jgi:hypothetical protein
MGMPLEDFDCIPLCGGKRLLDMPQTEAFSYAQNPLHNGKQVIKINALVIDHSTAIFNWSRKARGETQDVSLSI